MTFTGVNVFASASVYSVPGLHGTGPYITKRRGVSFSTRCVMPWSIQAPWSTYQEKPQICKCHWAASCHRSSKRIWIPRGMHEAHVRRTAAPHAAARQQAVKKDLPPESESEATLIPGKSLSSAGPVAPTTRHSTQMLRPFGMSQVQSCKNWIGPGGPS